MGDLEVEWGYLMKWLREDTPFYGRTNFLTNDKGPIPTDLEDSACHWAISLGTLAAPSNELRYTNNAPFFGVVWGGRVSSVNQNHRQRMFSVGGSTFTTTNVPPASNAASAT